MKPYKGNYKRELVEKCKRKRRIWKGRRELFGMNWWLKVVQLGERGRL